MYKVGICGHFGWGKDFADGQTDKTRAVYRALSKALGEENITTLDTCGWKSNPAAMFLNCRKLLKNCENVIMMPAQGGVKIFPALYELFNRKLNRRLHYVVVGGWLPEKLKSNPALYECISRLDKVYVELQPMEDALHELGLDNVIYLPNFRETNSLRPEELVYTSCEPYRLCTFSRVTPQKGIEKAIDAVRYANNALGRTVYTLDIYGKVAPEYADEFSRLCKGFEPYITYKGLADTAKSTQELKSCFALLFPTLYSGEGLAGTVIDAFAAGVPVIATDWNYNRYIIRNGKDGIVYDPNTEGLLGKILVDAAGYPHKLNDMKKNCLNRAAHFEADQAVKILLKELEKEAVTV
ncbi:MAG: glycosyltransferase [Clostridia bacterium]|nr:glycosyltransferase [Clostridia bacterium]